MSENYVSTNMESGVNVKKALRQINDYHPDSFVWIEIPDTETIDLKSPTSNSSIKDPGDYSIYKFTNGPSEVPETISPVLLSIRNGKICVTANGTVYSLNSENEWYNIEDDADDSTIIYVKSNVAPSRTTNTFWFDTSDYNGTGNENVTLKYYDTSITKNKMTYNEELISDTSRNWVSVCYGNGKFVAISGSGGASNNDNHFAYSTDGISWTEGTISSTSRAWNSICYGNDKFVAVASNTNYFVYSTDGINWTEGTISSTSRHWYSVCYGNGKFVAISKYNSYFAYSTDGISWTEGTISSTNRYWDSVCYGNDKFVAVAYNSNYFAYSTDGITWTEGKISSTNRYWDSVCYGNDKFVAVADSYIAYSTDGINWTGKITTIWWGSVCYGNGKFVMINSACTKFTYSTDGITWIEKTMSTTGTHWDYLCYGNDKYVAVSTTGYAVCFQDAPNNEWVSVFSKDTDYLKKSELDPDNKETDIFAYINDKVSEFSTNYSNFSKHKNNELTLIHVTKDDRAIYANIITEDDVNGQITGISTMIKEEISHISTDYIPAISDVENLEAAYDEHIENHITVDNITSWNNKADGDHTHNYTNNDVQIYGKNIVDGIFTEDRLPDEIKERYYKLTQTAEDEFSNTSITDDDRSSKYHNGNAFYYESTNETTGKVTRTWYRIIDSSKIGTSDWANGVVDFTSKETYMNWDNITNHPTTLEEFGITNDLYTKTQIDENLTDANTYIDGDHSALDELEKTSEYKYINNVWTKGTISDTSRSWNSVCYGNGMFIAVGWSHNYFAYSTDGITWTEISVNHSNWQSVCYGNEMFVAVAGGNNSNYCAYSTDGIHWTEGTISDTSRSWESVCYGNDKFVAIAITYSINEINIAYSTDGITWTEGMISDTSRRWNSVCYGNGKFVAVGNDSNCAYSTDGINWIVGSVNNSYKSICYGNGKFVAVGYNYCAYSTDGINWTEGAISETSDDNIIRHWESICYGNGKFVAVGYCTKSGTVISCNNAAYSTDGINWTEGVIYDTGFQFGISWNSVCYGNDKFVAVGEQSNCAYLYGSLLSISINKIGIQIKNSDSLSSYTDTMTGTIPQVDCIILTTDNKIYKTTYNKNSTYLKSDGTYYTTTNSPEPLGATMLENIIVREDIKEGKLPDKPWNSVCYGNGKFIAVAFNTNYFAYSTDGINWTEGTISNTIRQWTSVCYGNDKFVAVAGNTNYFAYSTDGINWTESTISDTERYWCSICYGNNKFVAVAHSTNYFAYSTDGITWTEGTISSTSRMWQSVCYGNDKFVVVDYDSNYFAYSTDGINWTESTISDTERYWCSICYGNNKFVAVAHSTNYFAYSTDGINWTEGTISSTSRMWQSICYGNDKFVAVAYNSNYFAYSTDGITWTEGTISDTSRQWYSVCYGNGKFVTVDGSNYFAYSTDGITWTEGTISSTSRQWTSVCYGNGKFVTVDGSNYFAYSTDGITWTEGTISSTSRQWTSVCYGNGKFVVVDYVEYTDKDPDSGGALPI